MCSYLVYQTLNILFSVENPPTLPPLNDEINHIVNWGLTGGTYVVGYIHIHVYTMFNYHILNLVIRGTMYAVGYVHSTNLDSASSWTVWRPYEGPRLSLTFNLHSTCMMPTSPSTKREDQ